MFTPCRSSARSTCQAHASESVIDISSGTAQSQLILSDNSSDNEDTTHAALRHFATNDSAQSELVSHAYKARPTPMDFRLFQPRQSEEILPTESLTDEKSPEGLVSSHMQPEEKLGDCLMDASRWRSHVRTPTRKTTLVAGIEKLANSEHGEHETAANNLGQQPAQTWPQLDTRFRMYDEKLVQSWNSQMDTLLVFTGLFSGVVTAFNIQFYIQLLSNSSASSSSLGIQLSELAHLIRPDGTIPIEILTQIQPAVYRPPESVVLISSLWFSSLVYSLIAASLATLVKQWIQEYIADIYASPRERIRIREHRFRGAITWCMPHIVGGLPVLLRVALTIFLIGLIIFLQTIHPVVMWVVATPIIIWFTVYCASVVLPTIYSNCPYKSPEAMVFFALTRLFVDGIGPAVHRFRYISWKEREHHLKWQASLDIGVLVTADLTFSDEALETTIRDSTTDLEGSAVLVVVKQIMVQRLDLKDTVMDWSGLRRSSLDSKYRTLTSRSLSALMNILMDVAAKEIHQQMGRRKITKATSLRLSGTIHECLGCISFLLAKSEHVEETTFERRFLELLEELLVPEENVAMVSHATLLILDVRPSLLKSHLAVSYLRPYLRKLTDVAIRTSIGEFASRSSANILILWQQSGSAYVKDNKDYLATRLAGLAVRLSMSKLAEHIVHRCLDAVTFLEKDLGPEACAVVSKALWAQKMRIIQSHPPAPASGFKFRRRFQRA